MNKNNKINESKKASNVNKSTEGNKPLAEQAEGVAVSDKNKTNQKSFIVDLKFFYYK
jgi:hypothetical protein